MSLRMVVLFCSLAAITAGNAEDAPKDPRATVRTQYAKHSARTLGIVEPIGNLQGFLWKDGGTVGLELSDAKGTKHQFALYPPGGLEDRTVKVVPNLFVGGTHPTRPNTKMVDLRGPEEEALYGVLLRVLANHREKDAILSKDIDVELWETRKLWGTDLFAIHTFFHRLEAHFLQR